VFDGVDNDTILFVASKEINVTDGETVIEYTISYSKQITALLKLNYSIDNETEGSPTV
jgi:hypothetical protein